MADRENGPEESAPRKRAPRGGRGAKAGSEPAEAAEKKPRRKAASAAVSESMPPQPAKRGRGAATAKTAAGGVAPDEAAPAKPPRTRARRTGPDLRQDLREFATARPQGWGHEDWLRFLEGLRDRGHNIEDREAIGIALERERLDLALSRFDELPEEGRSTLVERFQTLWSFRNADVDAISSIAGIPREVADRVRAEV
jgi:hypothetical protein